MLASRVSSIVRRQTAAKAARCSTTSARKLSSVVPTSKAVPVSLAASSLAKFAPIASASAVAPVSKIEVLYCNEEVSSVMKFEEAWNEWEQEDILDCIKRTYQPNWKKRKAKHGFLARNATVAGRRLNKRRALAGRRISI